MTAMLALSDNYDGVKAAVLFEVRQRLESEPASRLVPMIRECAGSEELGNAVISAIHAELPWGWWLLAGHWGSSPEREAQNVTNFLTMHLHSQAGRAAKKLVDRALRSER